MKRIYLIDCPGIVPPSNNDKPQDILLRSDFLLPYARGRIEN